jgi:hypothetical protein
MLLVARTENEHVFDATYLGPARFVPCVGTEDEKVSRTLTAAFERGGVERVVALRTDRADDTAWCVGDDWWLARGA